MSGQNAQQVREALMAKLLQAFPEMSAELRLDIQNRLQQQDLTTLQNDTAVMVEKLIREADSLLSLLFMASQNEGMREMVKRKFSAEVAGADGGDLALRVMRDHAATTIDEDGIQQDFLAFLDEILEAATARNNQS